MPGLDNWKDSGTTKPNSKYKANNYFGEKKKKTYSVLEFEGPRVIHEKSEYMNPALRP